MENINLNLYSPYHKTGHTSKGDQRKWKVNNFWYKADYMGYEGLAEVIVSQLLRKSNVKQPFIEYKPVKIEYNGQNLNACYCTDFLKEKEVLIPAEKLFRRYTGESLALKFTEYLEAEERIQFFVSQMETITNLKNWGAYITAMLEIDAFFLNEDRHTNNIAVIYNEKEEQYFFSPFFDQGLCLLADTSQDYPLGLSIEECLKKIEAKPFHYDFDIQLEAAEKLYGTQIKFHFTMEDVYEELEILLKFYPEKVCKRVENLIRYQMRKYSYFMQKK